MKPAVIYCIPGLGLSHQIFGQIKLAGYVIKPLEWIEPQGWETIEAYAYRLAKPLEKEGSNVILIGHSFGGVLAQEISRIREVRMIFLISSIQCRVETPWRLKLMSNGLLHRLLSKHIILLTFPFWARTHSYRTPELRAIFRNSVRNLSTHYFQWSLKRLSEWQGGKQLSSILIRIHGTRDVTFLRERVLYVTHEIEGGDHNMIYLKGAVISKLIQSHLKEDNTG